LKALNWPQAESLLASLGLQQLNAIQTQTFSSLYHSNESLFLGAAVGTGKSVCALLAIFNTLMNQAGQKIIYVLPIESLCEQKFKLLKPLFQDYLNKKVLFKIDLMPGGDADRTDQPGRQTHRAGGPGDH